MDFHMHATITGQGEPLLLLHGNGEDSTYFSRQIRPFSRYFQVIALDSRGHGQSGRGRQPLTITQMARDTAEWMEDHQISSAHILGFSDGANIAMEMARQFPKKVRSLILDGGNIEPSGVKARAQFPIWLLWKTTGLLPSWKARHEILGLMTENFQTTWLDLAKMEMPVLVLAGDRDVIRESHTVQIAAALPDATLKILPGSHFVAAENPEIFNQTVLEFLRMQSENNSR